MLLSAIFEEQQTINSLLICFTFQCIIFFKFNWNCCANLLLVILNAYSLFGTFTLFCGGKTICFSSHSMPIYLFFLFTYRAFLKRVITWSNDQKVMASEKYDILRLSFVIFLLKMPSNSYGMPTNIVLKIFRKLLQFARLIC